MPRDLLIPAHSVASLLASVFGPAFYDDPRFGRGDLGRRALLGAVAAPLPDPWREVALNPQPLPPRESHALRLADTILHDVLALDRTGRLLGGEAEERTLKSALNMVSEVDEICPRWPRWPKNWPPPPPPPWERDEMNPTELLLFGLRVLAASQLAAQGQVRESLDALGTKLLNLSMPG